MQTARFECEFVQTIPPLVERLALRLDMLLTNAMSVIFNNSIQNTGQVISDIGPQKTAKNYLTYNVYHILYIKYSII